MSGLNLTAAIISDYASSFAKRFGHRNVVRLHLLAGVRRWSTDRFDHLYPDLGARVTEALERHRGNDLRVEGLSKDVANLLDSIEHEEGVWEATEQLIDDLDAILSELAGDTSAVTDVGGGGGDNRSADETANATAPIAAPADKPPFALNQALIERIHSISGHRSADITASLLADAHAVASIVIGGPTEGLLALIATEAELDPHGALPAVEISSYIRTLSMIEHPDARKCATQLALALVDVAEWAASLDATVTPEETDRIDDVRLALRAQLAERLDAESPAMTDFERKFAGLIGMESVKTELRKRIDYLVVQRRRARRGLDSGTHRMHLAFVGNPGTGKTTVARLYGEVLNDLGLLPNRAFIETDRSGLIGQYVGHTEQKTLEVVNKAHGGVLFVDEAYALADGYGPDRKGFGAEATDVLVKQMEDRREHLVVILAGYKEPTEAFLTSNPGLKSRVPLVVTFPDYSDDELVDITRHIAGVMGLQVTADAMDSISALLRQERQSDGFGNARTAENVLEACHRNVIARVAELGNLATEDETRTITVDDVPTVAPPPTRRPIGFAPTQYL